MQTEDFRKENKTYIKSLITDDMFIGIPAIVKKFDEQTQLLDVQPLLKELWNDEEENFYVDLPLIQNVPFCGNLDFGVFCVTFPVSIGTKVWLTGSNISLDDLLELDLKEPIDIRETRQFDLSDMIAIADFKTKKTAISNYDKDNFNIRLKNNEVYLKIKPDGTFINTGTSFLFGNDTADKALALAEKVNANFEAWKQWSILANTPMGIYGIPPAPVTYQDTSSGKMFTND